jgi:hypothetical protein
MGWDACMEVMMMYILGPHGASSLVPRGSPRLRLVLRVLLFYETSAVFFSEFISDVFCMKKTERGFLLKIASVPAIFIQVLVQFRTNTKAK